MSNLEPGAGAWKPGAAPALKSGWRTRNPSPEALAPELPPLLAALVSRLEVDDPELAQAVAEIGPKVSVPEGGDVPGWLTEAVMTAAIKRLAMMRLRRFIAQRGMHDERDRLRPEVGHLDRATEAYERSLDRLAMTVTSRARTGLDVARTQVTFAELLSDSGGEG